MYLSRSARVTMSMGWWARNSMKFERSLPVRPLPSRKGCRYSKKPWNLAATIMGWMPFCKASSVDANKPGTRAMSLLWSPKRVSPAAISSVVYSPGVSQPVLKARVCSVTLRFRVFTNSSLSGSSRCSTIKSNARKWSAISAHSSSERLTGTIAMPCSRSIRVSSTVKLFPSIAHEWAESSISLYSIRLCRDIRDATSASYCLRSCSYCPISRSNMMGRVGCY